MITLNDILFPVEKIENPAMTNSEYAYIVKGIVDGNPMDLNYCSKRYELVPNDQIFPKIEADLQARGYNYNVSYQMIDNVRFYANYTLIDQKLKIGKDNDLISPIIRVSHSYNGLTKYSISFGYFRIICSNGLVIPLEGQEDKNLHISGKHTKEIQNSLSQLWNKLDLFFSMQSRITEKFNILTDRIIVNYADRLEAVLKATNLKPSKSQYEFITNTIENEAKTHYNGIVNDWLIYNGINSYIHKGKDAKGNVTKALPEKKEALDKLVLLEIMN